MTWPDPDNLQASDVVDSELHVVTRRRDGRILLLVGNILVLVAFFAPWAELYQLPRGVIPGEGLYSQFVVVWWSSTNGAFPTAAVVLLPFVLILASSLALVVRSRDNRAQRSLMTLVTGAGLLSLLGTLIFFPFLSMAVPLSYPYYDTAVQYGAFVAILAFMSVIVGAGMVGW